MTYRNDVLEFGLEDTAIMSFLFLGFVRYLDRLDRPDSPVKVLRCADSNQGVGIGQARENADSSLLVSRGERGHLSGGMAYSLEFSNWARTAMRSGFGGVGGTDRRGMVRVERRV